MRTGGPVPYLVYPADEQDLLAALSMLRKAGMEYRFLGNGTNIVVADEGLRETLIRLTKAPVLRYRRRGDGRASAEVSGGFSLKRFLEESCRRGFSGLEELYWIPGTVGGAVKMNAGSFGVSVSACLERVAVATEEGRVEYLDAAQMGFGYRTSAISRGRCVLSAVFGLVPGDGRQIKEVMNRAYEERRKRHPMEYASAGSVFKAINGEPAWKYIEKAELKGARIGDACVSEKHANFIVNMGRARASDIKALVEHVKKKVLERTGVALEEEIEFWGFHE
jgi:UDP-N-acetylmuramate dehydrogenase